MLRFPSIISGLGLLGWIGITTGLAVTPTPTPTRFSNLTSLIPSSSLSATTSACCFIVLDTIYENWWQEVSTSTYYDVVNLTSITTLITPYPTVTSTNYETHVYTTNATFYLDVDIGFDPITLYSNDAPGPKETGTSLNANGTSGAVNQALTAVTTAGTVIHSPQAFWAYSTVRIITAAAVTDKSGNRVCGTASGFQSVFPVYSITTLEHTSSFEPVFSTLATAYTTYSDKPAFTGINSNVNSYFFTNQTATQTGVVISLTTPFVYAPTRGATLVSGEPPICDQGTGTENYGYPVQTLLDYLVKNPAYSSQYPGLEHCLPGGPEIIQLEECSEASPHYEVPGGDLTSSTVITVTPTGVTAQPASIASPTTAVPTQAAPTTDTVMPLPVSISTTETQPVASAAPPEATSPSQSENPEPSPATETSAGQQTPTSEGSPSPSTEPLIAEQTSTPEGPASSSTESPAEQTPTTPEDSSPSSPTTSSSSQSSNIESLLISTSPNPPAASLPPSSINNPASPITISPASSSAAAIANAIASAIDLSPITALPTLISGTSDLIISGATTLPVIPGVSLSGSTKVINGVTNVILSSATTVPVSQLVSDLPGSTTEIGGTLNVVLGTGTSPTTVLVNSNIPGLSGSTLVSVSGSQTQTFVVVSTPETIPVVLGEPTQSAAASGGVITNSSSVGLLQFTSAGPVSPEGGVLMSWLCGLMTLSLAIIFQ